jgi:serine/threonine protein kinase
MDLKQLRQACCEGRLPSIGKAIKRGIQGDVYRVLTKDGPVIVKESAVLRWESDKLRAAEIERRFGSEWRTHYQIKYLEPELLSRVQDQKHTIRLLDHFRCKVKGKISNDFRFAYWDSQFLIEEGADGNLFDLLALRGLNGKEFIDLLQQIAQGGLENEERGVFQHDLGPRNIVYFELPKGKGFLYKIIDYGHASGKQEDQEWLPAIAEDDYINLPFDKHVEKMRRKYPFNSSVAIKTLLNELKAFRDPYFRATLDFIELNRPLNFTQFRDLINLWVSRGKT